MLQLPLYDNNGKSAGTLPASEKLFGAKMNMPVVQTALTWFLASQRQGTHSTKTRAEVSGGGRKPWKQKGTGRARAGSIRSPLWRKGGIAFGPKPRSYNYTLPKKVRQLALKVVLSDRAREERIKVIDELTLKETKTKMAAKFLKDLGLIGKVLVLLSADGEIFSRAVRNIKGVRIADPAALNIHELMASEWILADKKAINKLEEALA